MSDGNNLFAEQRKRDLERAAKRTSTFAAIRHVGGIFDSYLNSRKAEKELGVDLMPKTEILWGRIVIAGLAVVALLGLAIQALSRAIR